MQTSATDTARFDLEHPIVLRTLTGEPIDLVVTTLELTDRVALTGTLRVAAFERLFALGACHLDDEPAPAGFEPDLPVRLRLQLRRPVAARFPQPGALLQALLDDADGVLRQTEAWVALEAMQRQQVPGIDTGWVEVGIRTAAGHGG